MNTPPYAAYTRPNDENSCRVAITPYKKEDGPARKTDPQGFSAAQPQPHQVSATDFC